MKKTFITAIICLITSFAFGDSIFIESFEYAKKGGKIPVDVTSIEHIGRDITVNGDVSGQENHIKIIIPSELSKEVVGHDKLEFNAKRLYVFEETGERIK